MVKLIGIFSSMVSLNLCRKSEMWW